LRFSEEGLASYPSTDEFPLLCHRSWSWEEDDGIPFEEKMEELTSELTNLFEEENKLQEEIRERLKVIGYDI